jgi:hypothetical protein
MCPLLELMANKAMKPRHWQRIMEVIQYNFDLESEGFCLKNILEAPLVKYKEDIEVLLLGSLGFLINYFLVFTEMFVVGYLYFSNERKGHRS